MLHALLRSGLGPTCFRPMVEGVLIWNHLQQKANPVLSANWTWEMGLLDFGRAGLRTVRIVRIVRIGLGAYRGPGYFFYRRRGRGRRGPAWPCAVFY